MALLLYFNSLGVLNHMLLDAFGSITTNESNKRHQFVKFIGISIIISLSTWAFFISPNSLINILVAIKLNTLTILRGPICLKDKLKEICKSYYLKIYNSSIIQTIKREIDKTTS